VLSKIWDIAFDTLTGWRYWAAVQPIVLILLAGLAGQLLAFEYVRSQYGLTPSLGVFLGSYVSQRIFLVTTAVAGLWLLFRLQPGRANRPAPGRIRTFITTHRPAILYRATVTVIVLALTAWVWVVSSPTQVSHITVKFMGLSDDLRSDALAYLVYELNRPQHEWHFDVDFRPFNELELTSVERQSCDQDPQPLLCYAEKMAAESGPIIGITGQPLNGTAFATHRGMASIISTADAARYAPLSSYEYLAYKIILQSMLIHLDAHGGLPANSFVATTSSMGGVFQTAPDPDTLKSTILAARLSPEEQGLLLNRFGPEYLAVCSNLLSLEWLYDGRVRTNLEKVFAVKLSK